MEKTLAQIETEIGSMRAGAAKYSKLAEERRAVGQLMVAERLTLLVADLEARVIQLEAMAKSKVTH
jgi:hypothetical protein